MWQDFWQDFWQAGFLAGKIADLLGRPHENQVTVTTKFPSLHTQKPEHRTPKQTQTTATAWSHMSGGKRA